MYLDWLNPLSLTVAVGGFCIHSFFHGTIFNYYGNSLKALKLMYVYICIFYFLNMKMQLL